MPTDQNPEIPNDASAFDGAYDVFGVPNADADEITPDEFADVADDDAAIEALRDGAEHPGDVLWQMLDAWRRLSGDEPEADPE